VADLTLVTYCGPYCGLCSLRNRVPSAARALSAHMSQAGYEYFGQFVPGFAHFCTFLQDLAASESRCTCKPVCGPGCGPPDCEIRACARECGHEVCALCDAYPCERIQAFALTYPLLLGDARRMREIGLEAWVAEQARRALTGFSYTDILLPPAG
jgi:hypothetical protein